MERNASLDFFKLLLALFVVGIHTHLLRDHHHFASFLLTEGLFRIAVPSFILISGYYFSNIKTFREFWNWMLRLLILFIFWTAIYCPFWIKAPDWPSRIFSAANGYSHLWYIIHTALAGLILFYLKDKSFFKPVLIAVILFAIGCVIQYNALSSLEEGSSNSQLSLYRNFLFVCFPFLSIGYYIRIKRIEFNSGLFLLSIILFVSELLANYFLIDRAGDKSFDILFSLIIITPSIFLLVKKTNISYSSGKAIATIATALYFVHIWVLKLLKHFDIQDTILLWCFTVIVSTALAFPLIIINKKIRYKIL